MEPVLTSSRPQTPILRLIAPSHHLTEGICGHLCVVRTACPRAFEWLFGALQTFTAVPLETVSLVYCSVLSQLFLASHGCRSPRALPVVQLLHTAGVAALVCCALPLVCTTFVRRCGARGQCLSTVFRAGPEARQ